MKNKILIGIFLTILCLPVFQKITRLFPETKLHGVEWKQLKDPLSYQNIINGSFQECFTKWFNQRIGFRSYLIKCYNQFYYSFFNSSPNTKVVIGKNGQLYLSGYINKYYSKSNLTYSQLTEHIKKLKKVQDLFNERGVYLILLISPSKASIYPEDIPDKFKKSETNLNKDHENMLMLLDKYNVDYIDGQKIFMKYKNRSKYNVFPKSGIHWNHLGVSLVINKLFDRVELLIKKRLARFYFNHIRMDDTPKGKENDIALLLNTWTNPAYGPFPHPTFKKTVKKNAFTPNTLIIGSSFTDQIAELLNRNHMTRNLSRFYYYSSHDTYSPRKKRPTGKLDWDTDVFNKDLIILENNEELLPGRYGFIDDALTMMSLDDLNNITFTYKNEKHVESLLLDGKSTYRFKKEVSGPAVFLKSNKINCKMAYLTASFLAKNFEGIQCNLYPAKAISAKSIDISGGYKKYTYVFKTTGRAEQDYELRFFTDDTDVRDKDTFIKDVKIYSTKH